MSFKSYRNNNKNKNDTILRIHMRVSEPLKNL